MSRKTFLTIASMIALAVGVFCLAAPSVLLESVKMAEFESLWEAFPREGRKDLGKRLQGQVNSASTRHRLR